MPSQVEPQISTVTGVDKLNATMEALSQVITSTQTLQATTMVGRGVLAPGKSLELGANGAVGAMDLHAAETGLFDQRSRTRKALDQVVDFFCQKRPWRAEKGLQGG